MTTITEQEYTEVVCGFSTIIAIEARCRREVEQQLEKMTEIKNINSNTIDKHLDTIDNLRQKLDTTEQQKIELIEHNSMLVERNDVQRTNIEQLQAEIERIKAQNLSCNNTITELNKRLADKDLSIKTLTEKLRKHKIQP